MQTLHVLNANCTASWQVAVEFGHVLTYFAKVRAQVRKRFFLHSCMQNSWSFFAAMKIFRCDFITFSNTLSSQPLRNRNLSCNKYGEEYWIARVLKMYHWTKKTLRSAAPKRIKLRICNWAEHYKRHWSWGNNLDMDQKTGLTELVGNHDGTSSVNCHLPFSPISWARLESILCLSLPT